MHHSAQASHGYWELNSGPHPCTLHQQSHLSSLFSDPPFFPSARGMHINFHPFTSGQRWERSTSFPSSSNDLAFTCLFEVIWFTLTYCCASWQIIWDYQVHAVFFRVPRAVCSRSGQHQSLLDHLWNSTFLLCLLHLPQLFLSSNCLSSLDTLFIYWLTAPPPFTFRTQSSGEKAPGCSLLGFCSLRWSPTRGVDRADEWNKGEGRNEWGERKGSLYLERSTPPLPGGEGVEVYVHTPMMG